MAFLISDFIDLGPATADRILLRTASARHDLTAVTVTDPREIELPPVGLIELEDAETGELLLVDTWDRNLTEGFKALSDRERRERVDLFRSAGVGLIDVRTDASPVDPVVRFFRGKRA